MAQETPWFYDLTTEDAKEDRAHVRVWVGRVLVLAALLITTVYATGAYAQKSASLEDVFQRVSPAVGALYAQKSDGSLQFLCSITATDKSEKRTLLLTALHCVEKGVSYMVSFNGKQFHSARVWSVPRWDVDPAKHRKAFGTPEVDMAFFAIEGQLDVPTVTIGNDASVRPGRQIVTVGFPLGVTKISYNGIVSGRLERPGSGVDGYLTLQIFGSPGSSGSAIIDQDSGTIIGVLVSARQEFVGLPVIFATPINYRSYLLEAGQGAK